MESTRKNMLIWVLAAVIALLLALLLVVINNSNYKLSSMKSKAASLQAQQRGANNQGKANSGSANVTATGDYTQIIEEAKQQANTDAADVEDEPNGDALSEQELNLMFDGGAR